MKCTHLQNVVQLSLSELCKLKKDEPCTDCEANGPNLWICLQKSCLHIGCSEQCKDHSTIHFQANRSHCIHMNLSSQRVWCYLCESEQFFTNYQHQQQLLQQPQQHYHYRRTSIVSNDSSETSRYSSSAANTDKLIVHADKLVTAATFDGAGMGGDSCDSSGEDDDFERQGKWNGLVGLQNIANTCYMNAALQALSNSPPLTGFFLDCGSILETDLLGGGGSNTSGTKPGLAKQYHKLIREMWCKNRRYVVPGSILCGIRIVHPMFRGYQQHDTQEFLRCFMDQLHEELKEVMAPPPPDVLTTRPDDDDDDASDGHPSPCSSPSPSQSEGEYETCDSGVSERSSLSDDQLSPGVPPNGQSIGNRFRTLSSRTPSPPTNRRTAASGTRVRSTTSPRQQSPVGSSRSGASSVLSATTGSTISSGGVGASNGGGGGGGGGDPSDTGTGTSPPKEKSSQRSIISDIFDGKLLSSVQCLTCDRVSTREETFQDLSLPIPGKDHLAVLHQTQSMSPSTASGASVAGSSASSAGPSSSAASSVASSGSSSGGVGGITCSDAVYSVNGDTWLWWFWNSPFWSWVRSWFWGPAVTLHDCMAAFFSADELKGDNMYSCERCNKLRNGVKYSRVLALPEMLCVHLKRFRHDLSYSSKISSAVHFPLYGLDMRPYLHKDCRSEVTSYDLCAVICHHGTVGGGHYTSFAKHDPTGKWFEFDDQLVTQVTPEYVQSCEAYVLFYRKNNAKMVTVRAQASNILTMEEQASDIRFYVSRNWLHRFNTFAEPGPIDNWTLLCPHGAFPPNKASHFSKLVVPFPQTLWDFLYKKFGGGPVCNHIFPCHICKKAAELLSRRQRHELETFTAYNDEFQFNDTPTTIYAISMAWFRQWQLFARGLTTDDPGPINNRTIAIQGDNSVPLRSVRPFSDYAQINANLWHFFHGLYGGGPEIVLQGNPIPPPPVPAVTVDEPKQKPPKEHSAEVMDVAEEDRLGTVSRSDSFGANHADRDSAIEVTVSESTSNDTVPIAVGASDGNIATRPQKSVSFEDNDGYRDGDSSEDALVDEETPSDRSGVPLSSQKSDSFTSKRKAYSKGFTTSSTRRNSENTGKGGDVGTGPSKRKQHQHGGSKQPDAAGTPLINGLDNAITVPVLERLEIGSKKDRRHKASQMKANGFFGPEGKYQSSLNDYTNGDDETDSMVPPEGTTGVPRTESFSHYQSFYSGGGINDGSTTSGLASSYSVPTFGSHQSESVDSNRSSEEVVPLLAVGNGGKSEATLETDDYSRNVDSSGSLTTSSAKSHHHHHHHHRKGRHGGSTEEGSGAVEKSGGGMSFGRRKLKIKYMKKLAARAGGSRSSRNNGTVDGRPDDDSVDGVGVVAMNGVSEHSEGVK
ncbi:ubiquitin carboxyl-terminal hydrolase 20 [Anopheles bellator]|uniref:ubiquitin carboxyl-terminal hydrolase 20 n=1 Tax=Anopheles bellator TaxID=139047 RepID=UPI002648D893|nr:ubiquitin carboxyl-terminal hydrolase 20 [Anopheles bellator]